MNVLVLAAHPDDEVLGCGGTIARRASQGDDVYVAIMGEGITSRYDEREKADPELLKSLHAKSSKVAELLGAKDLFMHDLPDNRFDSVPLLDIVKKVEALIEKLSPRVVYTQHGGDLNIDHQILYRATLTATRPMVETPVDTVYAYEVASSTEWAFQKFEPSFRPTTFVDISETLELKIKGMETYESESRAYPHPRAPESLQAIARRWGTVAGMNAAEAFELVRDRQ